MKTASSLAVAVAVLLSLAGPVHAQTAGPRLFASVDGRPEPVALTGLSVRAHVLSAVAETRVTMTFTNRRPQLLEGEFEFPLPAGAFVSGYALDIGGTMVDGVVVEKDRGRVVFEEIARQRIDPGLVEWVAGNSFRTRVYPIPPQGSRTVMVRYVELLGERDGRPAYVLPLRWGATVASFDLVVEGDVTDERRLAGARLVEDVVVELPGDARSGPFVERSSDGEFWFGALLPVPKVEAVPVDGPRRITVLWDASLSRAGDRERELRVLGRYLAETGRRRVDVDLVVFRNVPEAPRRFAIVRGDVEPLLAALRNVAYDGGTSMGALAAVAPPRPDLYVLFGDGLSNFGAAAEARFDAPLFAVSDDPRADGAALRSLATSSGGAYIDLRAVAEPEAACRIGSAPIVFRGVDDVAGLADVLPRRGAIEGGRVLVVGRLLADEAAFVPRFDADGRTLEGDPVSVSRSTAREGDLLRTLWAQSKLADLLGNARRHQAEIVELGRRFGLVTPGTSLIVLERPDQYIRYGIEPPASKPEWVRAYRAAERARAQAETDGRAEQIEFVLGLWNARVQRWEGVPKAGAREALPSLGAGASAVRVSVSGVNGDGTAASLIGATVVLSDAAGRYPRQALFTDESGQVTFGPLPAGSGYSVAVTMAGYSPITKTGLRVVDGVTTQVDLAMIALQAGKVTVIGRDTVDEARRTPAISAEEFRELPVFGRDDRAALMMAQGVLGNNNDGNPNVHGSRERDFRMSVDGVSRADGTDLAIAPWNPGAPYLAALRAAAQGAVFDAYLAQRPAHGRSPGFFLDVADLFAERQQPERALQVLSNLAELELDDPALLRILGHRLVDLDRLDLAGPVFERVLELRPEEPQSWRDLALVLARQADYGRAMALLKHVVLNRWGRFDGIQLTALMELNRLIPEARAAGVDPVDLDPRLVKPLDADLRVVLTWAADATDLDLWVTEPDGTKCFYGRPLTPSGGAFHLDYTDGYGPEEYLLRAAPRGRYAIDVNYYGGDARRMLGPLTLNVTVFTNYGRPSEQRRSSTVRLADRKEVVRVTLVEM